jgi:serine/threonine protein kinase/predicted Zn-dependent protease
MARDNIGGYEITGTLGTGGFGIVYRGYDPKMRRNVAIKVLTSHGDASLISRFRSEAETAGNLHHKNIVTIYEFRGDDDPPFLAMEYLDGLDLHKVIADKANRESLTLLEKLEIMADVAQGLQCAHENGVVHRDVKPANIMRLKDGSVKIMDFGIARLVNAAAPRQTQAGMMIGSVLYMAPEQVNFTEEQFKPAEADALCDIWSYGVVFYEFLTGVHPFLADDLFRVSWRIRTEEPPPVASLLLGCPPELSANLQRLLSKDRDKRIQSLDDFLLDLEPITRNLAKIEIPGLLSRAERLIESDHLDTAQSIIGRILKLDRSNEAARRLRDRLRERSRLRPKIDALLREAEEQAAGRNFAGAIEKLNSAMNLDPGSPAVRSRVERLHSEEQRAKQADELIRRGRRALNEGDLTGAFTNFSEALETDPGHDQAPALLDEVKRAKNEREIQADVKAVMKQANDLILIQDYDDAIALLADLEKKTGPVEQVARRLIEARQLKRAQEINERLNADINEARDLLKRGSHEEACRALEALNRENPDNPTIEVLLAHARERLRADKVAAQIEAFLTQARGQRAGRHFDEALQCIARALELDRTNGKALALQRTYLDEAQADRDRKKIDFELQQFLALFKQEKLDDALAFINQVAADYPREPRVAEAKLDVAARIAEREELRRSEIQKGIQEAQRLLAEGRAESATSLLGDLTRLFPAEAAMHELLDRARELKQSQDTQDRLNAGLNAAAELLKDENFEQACNALEELSRLNPNNSAIEGLLALGRERLRAIEVADQIEKLLSRAESERTNGKFEQALQFVQISLQIDSTNNKALALREKLRSEQQLDTDRRNVGREVEKIRVLLKENNTVLAQAAIQRLEAEYPGNPLVIEAKRSVDAAVKKGNELRKRELRTGVEEAERLLSAGLAASATKHLESLIMRFPEAADLRGLLERAHQLEADQKREEIRNSILKAREFICGREWDKALALIGRGRKKYPDCREYVEETENIERLRHCDRELSAVEAVLKGGQPDEAVSMAEKALARFPGEPRAAALLQTARNLRELKNLVLYARRRVTNGDLDEARQLVKEGRARFPDSLEFREIENEIEEAQGLDRWVRDARQALQNRNFADARNILSALLKAQPKNAAALQLVAEIEAQEKEYDRHQAYDRGRTEAERLFRSRQFGSAIEKLQELLRDFPADPGLREDIDRASAALDQQLRQEVYARGRSECQSLAAGGHHDEAIAKMEALLRSFPGDAVLLADLKSARETLILRQERARLESIIGELDNLYRKGNAKAVQRGARELLKKHKEPRAIELLEWADRSIKQAGEIRRQARNRRPALLWAGLASGAALVLALIIWPQEDITVQPDRLTFTYQRGGPIPTSQTLHIVTHSRRQSWKIAGNDPWLIIATKQGAGTQDIKLSVEPAMLPVGDTTIATVTAWPRQKTFRVTLRITEPPRPEKRDDPKKEDPLHGTKDQGGAVDKTQDPIDPRSIKELSPLRDCSVGNYHGLFDGKLPWRGEVQAGESITISADNVSPGYFERPFSLLPGCPVDIHVPPDWVISVKPSEANRYLELQLKNNSGQALRSVDVHWDIVR